MNLTSVVIMDVLLVSALLPCLSVLTGVLSLQSDGER